MRLPVEGGDEERGRGADRADDDGDLAVKLRPGEVRARGDGAGGEADGPRSHVLRTMTLLPNVITWRRPPFAVMLVPPLPEASVSV